ncbi:MAG: universal stress protein [Desulfosarcina sp.]|nr:universal stress protein [Desulfobacterales bacterium]
MMFNHILLCTHGSNGALKAEKYVFEHLLKGAADAALTVLTVINEDWQWMIGDDWLNTSKTRNAFLDHVSNQLAEEIEADWQRIRQTYPAAAGARFLRAMGAVEETITRVAGEQACDLIVIGPYQKKHSKGLKARMKNQKLHPLLPVPLLVAP